MDPLRIARRAVGGLLLAATLVAALAGCGGSTVNASDATQFFRAAVAVKFNGNVPTGNHRGCVKVSAGHFSCTATVSGQNLDIIGEVTAKGSQMTVSASQTTDAGIQAWLAKTGGVK